MNWAEEEELDELECERERVRELERELMLEKAKSCEMLIAMREINATLIERLPKKKTREDIGKQRVLNRKAREEAKQRDLEAKQRELNEKVREDVKLAKQRDLEIIKANQLIARTRMANDRTRMVNALKEAQERKKMAAEDKFRNLNVKPNHVNPVKPNHVNPVKPNPVEQRAAWLALVQKKKSGGPPGPFGVRRQTPSKV